MKKDAVDIILNCLQEKLEDLRLTIRMDLKKMTLSQIEQFNNKIHDLEYAIKELKGDKSIVNVENRKSLPTITSASR